MRRKRLSASTLRQSNIGTQWKFRCNEGNSFSETIYRSQHTLCPRSDHAWWKYSRDSEKYRHNHSLPLAAISVIKPILWEFIKPELLKNFLCGKTQNNNENFNNTIMLRCPKAVFIATSAIYCFRELGEPGMTRPDQERRFRIWCSRSGSWTAGRGQVQQNESKQGKWK